MSYEYSLHGEVCRGEGYRRGFSENEEYEEIITISSCGLRKKKRRCWLSLCEQRGAVPAVDVPRAAHQERFLPGSRRLAVNFTIRSGILHLKPMRSTQNWVGFFWRVS